MSEKINAGYMYARLRQGKVPCVKELTFLGKSIIWTKITVRGIAKHG